jgi:HD superfamily phosphohydrolase
MLNWKYKIFRDNIHGYIKMPVPFVEEFIDTELFQRLRYIEQTGMRILYPSARHDRFIHSLGTFHLGKKAYEAFRENVKLYYNSGDVNKNHYKVLPTDKKNEMFWDKHDVLFSIACLLHDCGHAPFSHTLEYIYDIEAAKDPVTKLNRKITSIYKSHSFIEDFNVGIGKEHERMSAILVKDYFGEKIKKVVNEKFERAICDNSDLEFIARAIIGCQYKDISTKENQIKNCFIQLLNSKSIDVDGLDYIIRDSKLSGIETPGIDADRLIGSLTIIETTNFQDADLSNYFVDSHILSGNLNGIIDANVSGIIDICNFTGTIKGKLQFVGQGIITHKARLNNGCIKVSGAELTKDIPETRNIVPIETNPEITMTNLLSLKDAEFKSNENQHAFIETAMNANITFGSVYYKGTMNGKFTGKILGNHHCDNSKVEVVLAFHKSSLSVLQNVISARNYEYLWIYGHHKVAYYSNYLLVCTLRETARYLISKDKSISVDGLLAKFLAMYKINRYKNHKFFRNNDSDIIALFRECNLKILSSSDHDENKGLLELYNELFSRKYKKSVWKSFAEYNYFFRDLSDEEKESLFSTIKDNSSFCTKLYGYFNEAWTEKFREFGMHSVVWVDPDVKLKDLNLDNTFILLKEKPVRLRDVSILGSSSTKIKTKPFYLYYSAEMPISLETTNQVVSFLIENARKKAKNLNRIAPKVVTIKDFRGKKKKVSIE